MLILTNLSKKNNPALSKSSKFNFYDICFNLSNNNFGSRNLERAGERRFYFFFFFVFFFAMKFLIFFKKFRTNSRPLFAKKFFIILFSHFRK
ncbi:MAG: hypothetical protein COZ89_03265 [Candidatus Nealsonbacteria bacterium CG_4_8_14_3_um_filter_37_23]|nr:MAG: hypothetical protein COZ89_03265 [Candidatus Nealsonbacteria bacterium CG_4_8_14_3_um_filter_37_23]